MPDRIIFLDLDGVLVQWVETVVGMFGREMPPHGTPMPWDTEDYIGISSDEMWGAIYDRGAEWWADLPAYPWALELVTGLRLLAPVAILTAPCKEGFSAHGKVQWMRRFFGPTFRDYIITAQKHLCARPGAVLVDDTEKKVNKFRDCGGEAVLFPRPWNYMRHVRGEDAVKYTLECVSTALCG